MSRVRDRAQPLLAPADRGPQGDPVVADLALGAELLEGLEAVVGVDRLHARVVELVEVDVVGAQAAEARLEGGADERAVPVLRAARPGSAPGGRSSRT